MAKKNRPRSIYFASIWCDDSVLMIDSISDVSLKKHTGKVWKDWIQILNQAGASSWSHQEIVAHLKKKHRQSLWWQQMIANGYEVTTGKRIAGQSLKGTYSATLTKSISVDQLKAWRWCISDEGIEVWLKPLSPVEISAGTSFEINGGVFGEIRTVKKNQRIRMTWCEPEWEKSTTVQLHVYKKAKGKSLLVIQHDGLKSARQKTEMRTYWRSTIEKMALLIAAL